MIFTLSSPPAAAAAGFVMIWLGIDGIINDERAEEGGTFRPSVLFVRISREPRRGGGGELQVSINQRESVRKDLLVVEEEEGDRSMKRLFGSAQQLPQGEKKREGGGR